MSLTFNKKVENFTCEHCGTEVKGSGYTNHCPQCLWSKHVDVYPGDRAATCKGMMKPIDILDEQGEYQVVNECIICGYRKKNKLSPQDNFDAALKIVRDRNHARQ